MKGKQRRKKDDPKPRLFIPADCSTCVSLRVGGDDDRQYTRVYVTKREGNSVIRYIRCDYCGNTFKQVESV